MWKKPDFVLIAALSGIVGASCVAAGYILFLSSVSAKHIQPVAPASEAVQLLPPDANPTKASIAADPDASRPTPVPSDTDVVDEPLPATPVPQAPSFVDHRYDGVITPAEVLQIKGSLRLSSAQESKWRALAAALREASAQQRERIDGGQALDPSFNEQVLATLIPVALPLVQTLRGDQVKGAGKLSRLLGYRNTADMIEAANASTKPIADKPKVEQPVAVTPKLPPIAKAPILSTHRYDGVLTAAEVNRIKLSLKLRPEQEAYWPPVSAILRELGQQQMAQVDAGQQLDSTMSGGMAQRFYLAASPLLQTLSEEQKAEVRRRARMMGLEAYASYL